MTQRDALAVDDSLLADWPLPVPDGHADKEERGRVLVIAGSREMPGAAVLAGTAALRAGAGKLAIAAVQSVACIVAVALPEARVISLPESPGGGPLSGGVDGLRETAERADAILIGPGMTDAASTVAFVRQVLGLAPQATVVLDALAMDAVHAIGRFEQPVILTPHAGEMAHLTRLRKDEILAAPEDIVRTFAQRWGAVVALKGATSCIAGAQEQLWRHVSTCAGLGTSGSGDVLAGIIAGLAARGASPEQAAVWGVTLHARAGERLARDKGSVGFLAREIGEELPRLLDLCRSRPASDCG